VGLVIDIPEGLKKIKSDAVIFYDKNARFKYK